jgi:flagellar hook-associated protein 1
VLGFSIGLRALDAAQQAMDVIGQNVSNAATPGYSRRLATLVAADPIAIGGFSLGTGVLVASIRRVHDDLLEARLRDQHQVLGQLDASGGLLQSIESAFQEPGDGGLAAGLDGLWNGFSQLTSAPADTALRGDLVQSASTLAARFRQAAAQIAAAGDDARSSVVSAVDEVNALATQIAALNARITKAAVSGAEPGDLLDQQGMLLQSLSDLVDARAYAHGDGSVDVLVDGRLLVSAEHADQLVATTASGGAISVQLASTHQEVGFGGGKIAGYLDVARRVVPQRLAALDRVARELMLQVNKLHTTGVSALGSYTNLVAAVAVDASNGGALASRKALDQLDLPFAITNGRLTVNVVNQATGDVQQSFIDVDPRRMTLDDLVAKLDGIAHLSANLDATGRLHVVSAAGYGFDFSPRLDPNPDDADAFGSTTATISTGSGPFPLNVGDTLTIDANGTGPQTVTFQASDFADITHATAEEVAAVLNARMTGVNAVAEDGRLVIHSTTAGPAGSLQVVASSNAGLITAGSADTGGATAVGVKLSGAPSDGRTGHFTVVARGDGTVGLTAGLKVEVLDGSGKSLGLFDVGSGYTPGDSIEIVPGVSMTLQAGDLEESHGDAFGFDLVGDSDSAGVLSALQLGALFTGSGAADLDVAAAVAADPRLLAGSRDGDPNDGSNFTALAGLGGVALDGLSGRTLTQSYGDLVASVGQDVATNQTDGDAQAQLLSSLETKRESLSGVNQDEEMVNLLQYQHLYQGASKYLATLDQVQQSLFDILQ